MFDQVAHMCSHMHSQRVTQHAGQLSMLRHSLCQSVLPRIAGRQQGDHEVLQRDQPDALRHQLDLWVAGITGCIPVRR